MVLNLDHMTPGQRLRVLRVASGLKLWELSAIVGLAEPRISELENGRRPGSPQEWERLQEALGQRGITEHISADACVAEALR